MNSKVILEQLDIEYLAHLNGWEPPQRIRFYCFTCGQQHNGVIARRCGLDNVYTEDEGGKLEKVYQSGGAYYCRVKTVLEEAHPALHQAT
jgi:hypothetical protein